jgi:putative holliday junction resolvase
VRTLAIDLGTRRVGLALSDEGGRFATPWDILTITAPEQASDQILAIVKKEGIERLVVGVPLNMDESLGPAARTAISWARTLATAAGKPLVFIDERLSSFEADETLSERKRGGEKMTRKDRKGRLDAIAAAGFLQAFLDGRLPELKVE